MNSTTIRNGQRFTRLVVQDSYAFKQGRQIKAKCICDCGKVVFVFRKSLVGRFTKSCGCLRKELLTTHGMTNTPTYRSWDHMVQRGTNPNCDCAKHYTGRGIRVCERWLTFQNFLTDMGVRPKGTTLERIDNNRGYEPGNCEWKSRKINQGNRRQCRRFLYQGETLCATHWAERFGINPRTFIQRLDSGIPFEVAISAPVIKGPSWKRRLCYP